MLTMTAGLLAVATTGCGSSSSASSAKHDKTASIPAKAGVAPIGVGLSEWKVEPGVSRARSGKVTFAVKNSGKIKHEFVVLKSDRRAAALGKGARVPETGNVGETGDLAVGASKKVTLTLKPGHYALVCNLPGHYASGMHADFTVK